MARPRRGRRDGLRHDAVAGVVLGVQSVPDGLATGLLAGVSPLAGLYGYLVGTAAGAMVTASSTMVVQGTGAMAMVVSDVAELREADDPVRALVTLTLLTGVVMAAAGLLKLGSVLRFVSTAVMTGFISAVGVNIVLGQLANLTGYQAEGANRVVRALRTVLSPGEVEWRGVAVGLVTVAIIVACERTRLGALGMVIAVVVTSAATAALGWTQIPTLDDLGVVLDGLPLPAAPDVSMVPVLVVPAVSLAFVGLVQGAAVSAAFTSPHGRPADASRDFLGQGVANLASGALRGMPVGGSVSGTALLQQAGARTRRAQLVAAAVMAVVVVALGDAVGRVAMPALAGLLMLIGVRTVKPRALQSVWRTGPVQKAVLTVTFALTLVIPVHYAVLCGVGLSVVLYVVRQSNTVTVRRIVPDADGHLVETDPPAELPARTVVVLQPYGSLFFAAVPVFEGALPTVTAASRQSVVILRLRGRTEVGATFLDVLQSYADAVHAVGSRLVVVSDGERLLAQVAAAGLTDRLGDGGVVRGDARLGAATRSAYEAAHAWVAAQTPDTPDPRAET